jgi:hypothetical protein
MSVTGAVNAPKLQDGILIAKLDDIPALIIADDGLAVNTQSACWSANDSSPIGIGKSAFAALPPLSQANA